MVGYNNQEKSASSASKKLILTLPLQRKVKDKAALPATRSRDGASVKDDGILYNGKAETCAAQLAATPLVDAVETLEDAWQVFGSEAHTVVGKGEVIEGFVLGGADGDGGTLAGIGDGIVRQVAEDGVEQRGIALDDDVLRELVAHAHAVFFQLQRYLLDDAVDQIGYADVLLSDGAQAHFVVHAVEDGYFVQQADQPLRLCMTSLEELLAFFVVNLWIADQRLNVALYAADRCLQFVRDVLGQLAFQTALILLTLLQVLVEAHNVARYFAQFTFGKGRCLLLQVEVLVAVSFLGKAAQLGDRLLLANDMEIEDEGHDETGHEDDPYTAFVAPCGIDGHREDDGNEETEADEEGFHVVF